MRQIPNKDPKFHRKEILLGVGKSIKVLLNIFISNSDFRFNIGLVTG